MTNQNIITGLLDVFQGYRMAPTALDEYEIKGKPALAEKMSGFVSNGQPISFYMLGYPMKSPNDRDKVIGKMPDLAEKVSIDNFTAFNNAVKQVYSPGVAINIVSDGYVFNDIMDTPDTIVSQYEEIALDMAKDSPLVWHRLTDFYNKNMSLAGMRDAVMADFGITAEELDYRILTDPDVNTLYKGMIKFLGVDLAIRNYDSGNQLHKAAKKMAREMMYRNEAYSRLAQKEFQGHIRLSMHNSINNGTKYSFQLIPGPKAWTSPWHCALLITKEGEYATVHRNTAEQAGFELVYKDGRPSHFVEN